MKIIGGMAFVKQVSFLSNRFRVTANLTPNGIQVHHRQMSGSEKMGRLYDIPVIRGLARILSLLLGSRVIWFVLIGLAALDVSVTFAFLHFRPFGISWPIYGLITPVDLMLLPFMVVFIKVYVGKFHGAEHKVFNAWTEGKEITLANVKKATRVSERCGTNLVVFIVLLGVLLSLVFPSYITTLLSIAIGYELFKSKWKYTAAISKLLCKIGGVLQYFLFTAEPGDKELEVAITAFNKLIELEDAHRAQSS